MSNVTRRRLATLIAGHTRNTRTIKREDEGIMTTYRKQINVAGVGACIAYARTDGTMWYNDENPAGRSFEPVSGEDINNYYETLEYGEKLTRRE